MPERQFGPYRLIQQIATGGMAEIYLARTKGIGGFEKFIALKMIHPNFSADEHFIQMLIDEAKISVQLQHSNIAQVFDLGRVGGTYYITMEFVDGCDLYRVLRKAAEKDIPMPLDVAVHIAKEVCMGLDYAHRKRDASGKPLEIVHRDISPQNVLVSNAAEVKIVDFGIAKATMRAKQTAVGVIKGKYYYMSPEQAWGDPLDARTDVFSAGILLYEMLTGQMLYLEEDMQRLLDLVRKAEIAPPSSRRKGVPPHLDKIVMKALARKREQRYASAHDFVAELEKFLHAWAPEFTSAKVATFVRQVVGEPQPLPAAEETHVGDAPGGLAGRVTRGMGANDLMARREFEDENSVLFRMADLARKAAAANGSAPIGGSGSGGTRGTSAPARVASAANAASAASRSSPTRPPPPAASLRGEPSETMRPPALKPRPRARDVGTRPSAQPEPDRTIVSEPPGFGAPAALADGGTDVLADDPAFDTIDPEADAALDRLLPDDPPTNRARRAVVRPLLEPTTDERAEDEPTRLDVGLVTPTPTPILPTPPPAGPPASRRPPPEVTPESKMDDDLDALEVPTARQGKRANAAPAPRSAIQDAQSPAPALSALAPRRVSRRTPRSGLPAAPVPAQVAAPAAATQPSAATTSDSSQVAYLNVPPPAPDTPVGLPLVSPYPTPPPHAPDAAAAAPWAPQPEAPPPWPMASPLGYEPGTGDSIELRLAPSRRGLVYWALGIVASIAIIAAVVAMVRSGAPPAPRVATIEVISIPAGATVKIDGTAVAGVTPLSFPEAQPGKSYRLVVELPRHEVWLRDESIPDNTRQVKVIASLKPILGRLTITSEPTGAEVFLNNRSMGHTPLLLPSVDPFVDAKVEVRLRGHKPRVLPVTWSASYEATLAFRLTP